MVLGVLPVDRSSARYWPGDFSAQAPPLELSPGASIGEELLIDFDAFGRDGAPQPRLRIKPIFEGVY
eukprot:5030515-Prymnesium_polylepis.2